MRAAYGELHRLGYAHSVESWRGAELVGGLYGVSLGRMFFGESMFARSIGCIEGGLGSSGDALSEWQLRVDRLSDHESASAFAWRGRYAASGIPRAAAQ